jgi:alanine dehydrogenase
MLIGVPKETKVHEYRVGLTPESVRELTRRGHGVVVESGAGAGIGADDAAYEAAGSDIVSGAREVFARAALIVKVKEPLVPERALLRAGQTIFTYLHLAPDPAQAKDLMKSGAIAVAYETITGAHRTLPLLAPMSEVAGRMSIQVAAHFLERPQGGRGVLLPGAAGVAPAKILVLGAGVVGSNAVKVALGMGAEVTVMNPSPDALERLLAEHGPRLTAAVSSPEMIAARLPQADAVIGAALIPGALAPRLVTREMLKTMKAGAVLVDVSIDQGGCFETSRPTTHADPTYTVEGIIHYCVANMPGAVPRTSAYALNHATLPFVVAMADQGVENAMLANEDLRNGLTVCRGAITRREVAEALGYAAVDPVKALEGAALRR